MNPVQVKPNNPTETPGPLDQMERKGIKPGEIVISRPNNIIRLPISKTVKIFPEDFSTVNPSEMNFRFVVDLDPSKNISDLSPCGALITRPGRPQPKLKSVRLQVLQPTNANTQNAAMSNASLVYSTDLKVPSNCIYTHTPPSGTLDDYTPYAWTTSTLAPDQMPHRFIMGKYLNGIPNSPITRDTCTESGIISNPNFLSQNSSWKFLNNKTTVPVSNAAGHWDHGFLEIIGANRPFFTSLTTPILKGETYKLSLSMKILGAQNAPRIRLFGLTSIDVTNVQLGPNVQLLAETAHIPATFPNWATYSLKTFVPAKDYPFIAIVVEGGEFRGQLDNIGICSEASIDCTGFIGAKDQNPLDIMSAEEFSELEQNAQYLETDHGLVSDIYGERTVLTTDWLNDQRDNPTGPMVCNSITNIEIDLDSPPKELDNSKANKEINSYLEESTEFLPDMLNLPPLGDLNNITAPVIPTPSSIRELPEYCPTDPNPALPFGGASIAYIRGFSKPHLDGNYDLPPTYQQRWRDNPEAFYKTTKSIGFNPPDDYQGFIDDIGTNFEGGEFWKNTANYWMKQSSNGFPGGHIVSNLGQIDNLSNSFVIINYSTNERLHWGIEAALVQISEAMRDQNNNVYLSQSDAAKYQEFGHSCFGSRGLVLISHSTGSILASSMLALSDLSTNSSSEAYQRYGNVAWLSRRTNVHVAFGPALIGSGLALPGISVMRDETPEKIRDDLKEAVFENIVDLSQTPATDPFDTVLVDLTPQYAKRHWASIYENSRTDTLMVIGDIPGIGELKDYIAGQILNIGFDDGVNSSRSQLALDDRNTDNENAYYHLIDKYHADRLFDLGIRADGINTLVSRLSLKAWSMVLQGRILSGLSASEKVKGTKRRYFVDPNLAPNGMLQNLAVGPTWTGGHRSYSNHYPIIQSTASHYDVASEWKDNAYAPVNTQLAPLSTFFPELNNEELGVVNSNDVYTKNLLSENLMLSVRNLEKKGSVGFHYPSSITCEWFLKCTLHWSYKEIIFWRRNYLHHNSNTPYGKRDSDFVYEHVLKD